MRWSRNLLIACAAIVTATLVFGPSVRSLASPETQRQPTLPKKSRKSVQKGTITGAVVGLGLGALAGDAELAAAGAAADSWYEYDQSKQGDRTQMTIDAIPGSKAKDVAPTETVGDVGKRHLQDLLGEWKVEMWGLDENGERVKGKGVVNGVSAGENATRIIFLQVKVDGIDETFGGGYMLLTYDPRKGFFLKNHFTFNDETLKFVGEYLTDKNAFDYYLDDPGVNGTTAEGIVLSSVRVEIRVATNSLWLAEAFTHIDGKEVKVQSYRFTKP